MQDLVVDALLVRFRLDCAYEFSTIGPGALARFLLCLPFFIMLFMMLVEASLHAATTYLDDEIGRCGMQRCLDQHQEEHDKERQAQQKARQGIGPIC